MHRAISLLAESGKIVLLFCKLFFVDHLPFYGVLILEYEKCFAITFVLTLSH